MNFDYFVGIDWSGAKGNKHRGLSVFTCRVGKNVPTKINPPSGKSAFSRADIISYLKDISRKSRVLAGIDFAFAYPTDENGDYFPNLKAGLFQPKTALQLWQMIDAINENAEDYYGGLIWDNRDYGPYYNAPSGRRGSLFASRRRQTEIAAATVKSPSPTFNCVGPAGVGTGSVAGMRLCHHFSSSASIWPFQSKNENLTLVEIFPSYYFKMAGVNPVNGYQASHEGLNKALRFFESDDVAIGFKAQGPDRDDADALISSAALRALSKDTDCWRIHSKAQREGWIFGVKSDNNLA